MERMLLFSTHLELEGVLVRAGIDSEASLGALLQILRTYVGGPYDLRLVEKLVDLEDWSLFVRSVWMYWCKQPRPRLAFELHDDAADVGGIWHPQKHLSLDQIEVGVVLVRVLESY